MRLQDVIHETWDCVGSALDALVEAANNDLIWASDVSGCALKKRLPIPEIQQSYTEGEDSCSDAVVLDVTPDDTKNHSRKANQNEFIGHESKRQRSDTDSLTEKRLGTPPNQNNSQSATINNENSHENLNVGDTGHEQVKDDKKQVRVLLKGRTRHKAKELLNKIDTSSQVKSEVAKITSPTTKVVNLASKADETRLNSDKRLQSTVFSSLDILRKGLMKKPTVMDQNQSVIVESGKRIVDSCGESVSSIENTSFARSSNAEIPETDLENIKLTSLQAIPRESVIIPRESTAIDRLSKIRPISQLKSIAIESASLEKDRKIILDSLQEAHLKSQSNSDHNVEKNSTEKKEIAPLNSNLSHIPTLKEVQPITPIVSKKPLETVPIIQNSVLDALDDKPLKSKNVKSSAQDGKTCILDENGNLPEIPSDDDSDDCRKLSPQKIANWAHTPHLRGTLETQTLQDPDAIFGSIPPIQLEEVFKNVPAKKFMRPRASSGVWSSLTPDEIANYNSRMGFKGK